MMMVKTSLICFLFLSFTVVKAQNNLLADMVFVEESSTDVLSFYMSSHEISVQDYKGFCNATGRSMPNNPKWGFEDSKLPIVNITYEDAIAYCDWISDIYDLPFSLPSINEWQYAVESGIYEANQNSASKRVIHKGNSQRQPKCISCMPPNGIGLYALCGNVWEWTSNQDNTKAYVIGGSYLQPEKDVNLNSKKLVFKDSGYTDVGFRVVVNAQDFEFYRFLEKAKLLLSRIKTVSNSIELTKKGIYKDGSLFIEWNNGFETFFYDENLGQAGFCCWVQNIDASGPKVADEMLFTFNPSELEHIKALNIHLNNFNTY